MAESWAVLHPLMRKDAINASLHEQLYVEEKCLRMRRAYLQDRKIIVMLPTQSTVSTIHKRFLPCLKRKVTEDYSNIDTQ